MEGGKVKVTYTNTDFGNDVEEVYDTVLLAVGRNALTADLNLEAAGVTVNPKYEHATNYKHAYVG